MTTASPIIDKVRKLLELSKSSNQHEAELAMQRAQDLLMAHNLDMAEVAASASKANQPIGPAPRSTKAHDGAAMYKYQRDLMEALAGNNFCYYFVNEQFRADPRGSKEHYVDGNYVKGREVKVHMLIGREENVVGTQVMYDYLVETMDRMLPWQGMEKRGKKALLWLAGCTETLVGRLNEQRWAREREAQAKAKEAAAQGGAQLVVFSDVYQTEEDLNNDERWGYPLGTTSARRAEAAARYAADKAKEDALVAQGMDQNKAWYVARGYDIPPTTNQVQGEVETEAQRKKREAKESREQARSDAKWERRAFEESRKRNSDAFRSGVQTGKDINLNQQVRGGSDTRRLA